MTRLSKPKRKTPTLRSISEDLDTSVCTVSRVLNGHAEKHRIAKATAERILEYANRVQYRPNAAAKSLRLNHAQDVGLVLPDFANPYFARTATLVVAKAGEHSFSTQVSETQDNTDREVEAISHLLHRRVAGLIVWPVGVESTHLSRLADGPTPVVLVDRCFPEVNLPQVSVDNIYAAYTATRHLIDHGHRKIACLQGLVHSTNNRDRIRGYRKALVEAGIDVDPSLTIGNGFTQTSGYESMRQLIKIRSSVTAVLSLSNQITLGLLRALAEQGIRIPDDISLVSFDDIEGVEFFATPLTVVSQPLDEIGEIATRVLFESIGGTATIQAKHEIVTASLISRDSVKRLK